MRFGILGPFEVADDEGREVALGGRKQRAVLAILLLHAGEVVSSDRLIDELWGEHAPATAAKTVQVYVSNLRKALGEGVVLTRAGGYLLRTRPAEIDLDRFHTLVMVGRSALQRGDPWAAAESLREALGLWRGVPLVDFAYEPFAQGEIDRLEEERLAVLADRIDAELELVSTRRLSGTRDARARAAAARAHLCAADARALPLRPAGGGTRGVSACARISLRPGRLEPGPELRALQTQILEQSASLAPDATDVVFPVSGAVAPPRISTPLIGRGEDMVRV